MSKEVGFLGREILIQSWIKLDYLGSGDFITSIAIGSAFLLLAFAALYLLNKRRDLSFKKSFWLFISLSLLLGSTFLIDAIGEVTNSTTLVVSVKIFTAIAIWILALLYLKMLPALMSMKSQNQLKAEVEEESEKLNLAKQELDNKVLQFKTLVNNLPFSISQLDEQFRYIFVNDTILKLTGLPESFFIGKSIYELGFSEDFIVEQAKHLKCAFEENSFSEFEAVSQLPQIGPRNFHITVVPVARNGKVESVLNIAQDVTVQKNVEEELNENIHELQELSENLSNKNRQLQEFAYIVSHNLRSPMGNLVSLMQIYEKEKDNEKKDFLVKKIGEVTRSFSQTIDELTEVVKIKQEKQMEFQTLRFEDLVRHIETILGNQISINQATIHTDFSACESIRYHKVYLESILLNLITNSLKYKSDKRPPEIHLSSKMVDGSILLVCADNGLGIDLNLYGDKIFGMHKTFHSNPDARGVGLFITKNQVESLGGSITVDSKPDKGSVFTVLFNG